MYRIALVDGEVESMREQRAGWVAFGARGPKASYIICVYC